MEYRVIKVSGSTLEMSIPPTVIVPCLVSQKRAARRETVVFPLPEGPTSAVTAPCFAVKLMSFRMVSPLL